MAPAGLVSLQSEGGRTPNPLLRFAISRQSLVTRERREAALGAPVNKDWDRPSFGGARLMAEAADGDR